MQQETEVVGLFQRLILGEHGSFRVAVEYEQTFEEMIRAGDFESINPSIAVRNFPPGQKKRNARITMEVIRFCRYTAAHNIVRELDTQGLRPATLQELLAFGRARSDEKLGLSITALGSIWQASNGLRYSPMLDDRFEKVRLNLVWIDYGLASLEWVAVVR